MNLNNQSRKIIEESFIEYSEEPTEKKKEIRRREPKKKKDILSISIPPELHNRTKEIYKNAETGRYFSFSHYVCSALIRQNQYEDENF